MKLEMDVISIGVVTPSSPTPLHLNNYKLSFLDQIMSHVLMPEVLFYPADNNPFSHSERSNHIKKSLSRALTLFYPLAGRLVGNSYVNCNDEGVPYVEAQASCKLSDFMANPIQEELKKFVPCDLDDPRDLCLVVQATFFCCGGLAIGLGISHKIADAFSYYMFVNSWAALSRGDDDRIQSPIFESAALIPPRELGRENFLKKGNKENFVNKRFVFTPEKISMLRDKYTNHTNEEGFIRPTRMEALSAFIWTRFMVATGAKGDTSKVYVLLHYVDIRTKVSPPLSENQFGNLILRTIAVPSLENDEESTYGLVKKIRDAIRNVDLDFVANISESDESLDALKIKGQVKMELEGKADVFRFSSLCRQPIYESDFGWGKPVWVALGRIHSCKMVHFMDSKSTGGIDALVNLKEEDMVKFEADEEMNQYIPCGDGEKHVG